LTELFPQATQEQVAQQIRSEEIQAAANLMKQGRNPSETVYRLAKSYGYTPKAPAAPAAPAVEAPRDPQTGRFVAVPQAPVADPTATLGSAGAAADTIDEGEMMDAERAEDILTIALRERFKR
jgi:hypothetical protein